MANGSFGTVDTVSFLPALTSAGPATLRLSLGELALTDSLTLTGPGEKLLTLDASASDPTPAEKNGDGNRIFSIDDGEFATDVFVSISDLTMTGGDADGSGGAIFLSSESLELDRVTISNNAATGSGGAIYSKGGGTQLNIRFSTLGHNTGQGGGAIYAVTYSGGSVNIEYSTIHNNRAIALGQSFARSGGGVLFHVSYNSDAQFNINSSTISGNSAGYQGGGIYHGSGDLFVRNSTITENTSGADGGGIGTQGERLQISLENTIVAGNVSTDTAFNDIAARSTLHYSLVGDGTGAQPTIHGTSLVGTTAGPIDPLLGPLADNGGTTLTHALLPGSPALNAGSFDPHVIDPLLGLVAGIGVSTQPSSNTSAAASSGSEMPPDYDQRWTGFSRNQLGQVDIGAYEAQIFPSADFDADGDFDGADFLAWQRGFGKTNANRADGNSDDDTDVDTNDLAAWQSQYRSTNNTSADLDLDDDVDGGDFLTWQRGFGTIYDASDLTSWQLSYGDTIILPLFAAVQINERPLALSSETLTDAAIAIAFLESEPAESSDFVEEPAIVDESFASTNATNNFLLALQLADEPLVTVSEDVAYENHSPPWLEEELLERVFG